MRVGLGHPVGRLLSAVLLAGGAVLLVGGCGNSAPASAGGPGAQAAPAADAPATRPDPNSPLAPHDESKGLLQLGHLAPQAPVFDVYFSAIGQDGRYIATGGYPNLTPFMELPPGQYVWSMRPAGSPASTPSTLTKLVNVKAGEASTVVLFNNGQNGDLQGNAAQANLANPPPGTGLVRVVQGATGEPISVTLGQDPAQQIAYGTITPYQARPAGPLTVTATQAAAPLTVQVSPDSSTTVLVTRGPDGVRLSSTSDSLAPDGPPTPAQPPASVNTGSGGEAATSTWPPTGAELIAGALLIVAAAVATGLSLRRRRA
ncbi:DUF4397 domain-containing protein [Pseudonocardia spinosispora]|uniref:DUF4397 domain-containing protein n=1 Tax=Pseudonocardia spinosispora TaxID=103441 RepID=UPI0003FEF46D|nr:DUF4397 domain-containing protein [Pseudonocardia spinosispora]